MKGKGTEGKHQASGPPWPCLSREDFFFNPKVKVFLFETTIYIPESKKKKKKQPSSRPISVPSHVTDTAS